MELKEIVALYRRWGLLLVAGLILGLGFALLASLIQTPVYEASTKVLVARNRQQSGADILALSDQQLVSTYQQLLKTKSVLDVVGSKLGIHVNPGRIRIDVLQNTQIIQITVQDTDRSRAALIANALVQVLVDKNESLQGGRYAAYEDGLNSQIAQVKTQIDSLQGQINQIDQANIDEQLAQVTKQIEALQTEITSLEKEIAQSPEAISSIARASLAEKQAQADQLRSLLALYQQIQTNLTYIGRPVQAGVSQSDPQIAGLQSTLGLYQQLYLNLLNNVEAVKLARVQSTPTVTQIEVAVPPERPVRPVILLYTALGGMVGLLIAAGAILLIDYFDNSFKTAQQVQDLLHAPVLGEVTDEMPGPKWYRRTVKLEHGKKLLDNSFGTLRINLNRLIAGKAQRTILVTSASHAEGKTTMAVNLAQSFARAGKKVLLVDADLRHPQIHERLGLDNHVGLADILSEGVDWQEVSCVQDNVTVITAGSRSEAVNGLLESEKMTDLLERLQRKADIVILDGPPLFVLDAQVLASKVGGVLLVILQGKTKTSIAETVKHQLDLMDVKLTGVVMNRAPATAVYDYDAELTESPESKPKEKTEQAEMA